MTDMIMGKVPLYSRPHAWDVAWTLSLRSGTGKYSTMIPNHFYDEGLGSPSNYNANRDHASFAVAAEPNMYPESKVRNQKDYLRIGMTKTALHSDNIDMMRVGVMVISTAFKEPVDAEDVVTATQVKDVLELQYETTHKQLYPLYNGTDVPNKWTDSAHLPANVPGLTGDTGLEYVDFVIDTYYNMLHYASNRQMMMSISSGLKWYTLTRDKPFRNIPIHNKSRSKAMNEYSGEITLVTLPQAGTKHQYPVITDTTADAAHLDCQFFSRKDEWNPFFDMERV
jgi:hypothetical protein